jgi:hypothetical protein
VGGAGPPHDIIEPRRRDRRRGCVPQNLGVEIDAGFCWRALWLNVPASHVRVQLRACDGYC